MVGHVGIKEHRSGEREAPGLADRGKVEGGTRREDLFERKTAGRCMQTSPPRPFRADRVTTVEESRSFAAKQLSNDLPPLALHLKASTKRAPTPFLQRRIRRIRGETLTQRSARTGGNGSRVEGWWVPEREREREDNRYQPVYADATAR